MNYQKIYDLIINRGVTRNLKNVYIERHHILPKSLGGTNKKDNIVELTAREHFICHFLLTKVYEVESYNWYKANHAFMMMKMNSLNHDRYFNSRLYEYFRKNIPIIMSFSQSGKKNSQYDKYWIYNYELEKNRSIKKDDVIPDGWNNGRIFDFKKHKYDIAKKEEIKKQTELLIVNRKKKFLDWYVIYDKYGFDEFCIITKYQYSKQNLVMAFAKYVDVFIPQNGKKRNSK